MNDPRRKKQDHREILIVEDTPTSLQYLTKILTGHGYRVRPATDGPLALQSVAARVPDMILLDVKMPDMDGYEVCRRLKTNERSRRIPVIFISALNDLSEKVKGFKAGGVDYITKPFEAEEVLARVRTHLNMKELTEDLERNVSERTERLTLVNEQLQQEIAERKRVEKELRKNDYTLRAIFNQTFQFIGLLEPDGTLLKANKTSLDFRGIEEKDVIGKPFWETIWWQHSRDLQERIRIAVHRAARGEFIRFETFHPLPDGSPHFIDFSLKPVRDDAGNVTFLISEGWDITERKLAEDEKKELESRLRQAMKMEAIGTLAGGIAHDFNNILSAIMGYTELSLFEAPEGSVLEAHLHEVFNATGRAKDLVQQILMFSRQTEQQLKPTKIGLIVKEALKLLRASLPSTIDIHQDIKSSGLVMADPTQIHQVVMNLCTNAGHAMEEKGGVLEVRLVDLELDASMATRHPDMKPGPHLELTVSDTGHGMTSGVLSRIFDPFFSTKGKGQGTGLGLSVVHGIVKSHGGTIHANSVPEKGTSIKPESVA